MSFWEKIKEQEVVDYRLIVAIPVILVVGVGVLVYTKTSADTSTSGRDVPAITGLTYVCHFDQTPIEVGGEALWEKEREGDAFISRGGVIPTRVRCPKCNRMSCFMPNPETGEPIEVDESWDLSEDAQPESTSRDAIVR
ncbi:hypothetical protein OT109_10155 [Phycisphaeraceae bacterium D3-23]